MPKIIAAGTADPPYKISQGEIKNFIYNLFAGSGIEIDRLISVFDNSEIEERHISVPPEWLQSDHTFSERNRIFKDISLQLSKQAVKNCLNSAGITPKEIDAVIYVTSTGVMTPTLDAVLFNELGFSEHIKRIPIWGLGCAGGAAAVSRAMDYTKAYPESAVLIIAIELCSLVFQKDDLSKSNVVAASLFSDGCAAVLASGDKNPLSSKNNLPYLIDSFSTIYKESLDVMGWDIIDTGFSVVFSRDIPAILNRDVKPNIEEFLNRHGLGINDIKHYITHPGGSKVLKAYEDSLELTNGALNRSRKILKTHGNMSSPSVLYVLKDFLEHEKTAINEYGLLSSLGPGFSSELILFKTA